MATRVASIVASIGIDSKSFDKGVTGVLNKLGLMNKDLAKFGVGAGVAAAAVGMVAMQMKKAMDITVTYADEVRTLSSVTMQSAEETSKMIQVLDDYGLSAQQAGAAARFLSKEGLSLNIETLAELSDKYKALTTGQERAEFLMKNFGKAGQDFVLTMEQGSEAILERNDAVKDGLILSAKDLKAAQDLKYAQDDLNESVQALYITVGVKAIPTWTKYLDNIVRLAEGESFWGMMMERNIEIFDQWRGRGEMNITTLEEMALAQTNYYSSLKDLPPLVDDFADSLGDLYGDILSLSGPVKDMYGELGLAALQAGQVMRGVTGDEAAIELLDFQLAMGMITQEVYNTKRELIGVSDELDGLSGREIFFKVTMLKYGFTSLSEAFSQDKPKGKDGKTGRVGGAIGDALGGPVRAGGWTMVGEQGFELIDPSGNVHSNQNSKRLLKQGVVPSRYAAIGTDEGGGVLNPVKNGLAGLVSSGNISASNISNVISGVTGDGGSGAVLQVAQQSVQASQQSAQASNAMVSVSQQSAQMQVSSNQALIGEIRALRQEFPRAVRDAVQQVIAQ